MAAFVHHAIAGGGGDDDENGMDKMSEMFGPGHVDQAIRQAISACWMIMPKNRKTVADVEKEIRRLMERALKDLREDADAFGKSEGD